MAAINPTQPHTTLEPPFFVDLIDTSLTRFSYTTSLSRRQAVVIKAQDGPFPINLTNENWKILLKDSQVVLKQFRINLKNPNISNITLYNNKITLKTKQGTFFLKKFKEGYQKTVQWLIGSSTLKCPHGDWNVSLKTLQLQSD